MGEVRQLGIKWPEGETVPDEDQHSIMPLQTANRCGLVSFSLRHWVIRMDSGMSYQSKMCNLVKTEMSNTLGVRKANIWEKQETPCISKVTWGFPVSHADPISTLHGLGKTNDSKGRVKEEQGAGEQMTLTLMIHSHILCVLFLSSSCLSPFFFTQRLVRKVCVCGLKYDCSSVCESQWNTATGSPKHQLNQQSEIDEGLVWADTTITQEKNN